ncbi:RND multidrug efflux transporter; Acriflavin resistance protein [invertebrate metagenome]|uniref:RND multidrug efflux transporter Acriflavin resistance protein n=1 Tax=invertebrate metagenome TaxID=1711999 RepID=A0A484H7L8_9ZZZZ
MNLIESVIGHARTVVTTLILILLAGTFAFLDIPKEAQPDINIPILYIVIPHDGISPADAERLLIRPMETELRAVESIKEMRATAFEGGAHVLLEFEAGFDADQALVDVREKVNRAKPRLPTGTDEPAVHEVNFGLFPVVTVTLSGDVPERTLLRLARDLEKVIERLPPVLSVRVGGDRDQQIEIIIDPSVVESYGLSAHTLSQLLTRNNRLIAAGALDTGNGRFAVKVPGLLESVEDIMELPVQVANNAVVKVRDIASVHKTFKDGEGFARINGKPAVTLEVSKRIGQNVIETVEKVRTLVAEEQKRWPPGVRVDLLQDQSVHIREMLHDLQNSIFFAIILVMVVVMATLGPRSGLIVSVAIPGSFLLAILFLAITGLTINVVVLFSLILAVGMLVDGAVIITEYADRKMAEGLPRQAAYALSSRLMARPVLSSTATTVAAFLPLLFWTGVVGEFMKYLPITLTATLVASLLMALVFVPTVGALVGKRRSAHPDVLRAVANIEHGGNMLTMTGFTGWYARLLHHALYHPLFVLLSTLMLLIGVQGVYWTFGRGVQFFPEIEPTSAVLYVHARGNLATAEKDLLIREIEERVLAMEQHEFRVIYALSGREPGFTEVAEDVIGKVSLEFADWQQRRPADVILEEVRRRTATLPGIGIEVRKNRDGPPVGKPVQIQLSAEDFDLLLGAVETVRYGMETLGGFTDIEDNRPAPGIEWRLTVNRAQAAKYGVDVVAVGDMVSMVTRGLKFTDYRPEDSDKAVDIVARFSEIYRTIPQLDRLRVSTATGAIPLSSFVECRAEPKTGLLHRVNGQRALTVRADVLPGILVDERVHALQVWLKTINLDQNIIIQFRGESEEQDKSKAFLLKAFFVALFLIAIILLAEFNSFYSMLLILSAVIFSTIGVMLGLLFFNQPFGVIMGGISILALAGVVVNNNIVLLDTYDRLQRTFNPHEAALRTGVQRLRPVLLTASTAVLGLLPMMFGINIDFVERSVSIGAPSMQWWVQLSTAIVFGLSFATVLTLIVTPSALMLKTRRRE